MPYCPSPIPTDHVRLPAELDSLTELLSQNTHEVWAAERISQGWRWGPRRNDAAKEHPCLIPYSQLTEAEKRLDRATAEAVLRVILALGYEIRRCPEKGERHDEL